LRENNGMKKKVLGVVYQANSKNNLMTLVCNVLALEIFQF